MSYIPPGTMPDKIWSYATRTLANHKRFLFIGSKDPVDIIGGFAYVGSSTTFIANGGSFSVTKTCVAGKVRVRVYVYTAGNSATITLSIDGTQVASASANTSSESLVIDYIGDITAGSHTFKVSSSSSSTGNFTGHLVIINGIGLDSTSSTTILTSTNVPSYVLEVNGSFKYEVGIRYKIVYNRKTTSTASITVNGEAVQNADLSANDDGDNTVTGYGTCAYNTTLTLAGAVGTTGDTIIITNLYVKPCLRGNQTYTSNNYSATVEMIAEEEGVAIVTARIYSLSGDSVAFSIYELQPNWLLTTYVSGTTTSSIVISGVIRPLANNSKLGFHLDYGNDSVSKSVIDYLLVVII